MARIFGSTLNEGLDLLELKLLSHESKRNRVRGPTSFRTDSRTSVHLWCRSTKRTWKPTTPEPSAAVLSRKPERGSDKKEPETRFRQKDFSSAALVQQCVCGSDHESKVQNRLSSSEPRLISGGFGPFLKT